MSDTPKLGLDEIAENQGSKYVTYNTAMRKLDCLVQATAKDKDLTTPPGSPSDGDTYIVGTTDSSSGDWEGHDDDVAYYNSTAWMYLTPDEGWKFYVQDEGAFYIYKGASLGWVIES